jgi:hypothetical protein
VVTITEFTSEILKDLSKETYKILRTNLVLSASARGMILLSLFDPDTAG